MTIKQVFHGGIFYLLFILSSNLQASDKTQPYLIGRGISDITGPLFGTQMWGFGREDQITEGLHIRQRSRAFVIAEADDPSKRLVFVSADLGSIEHHISLSVIDHLQQLYGDTYSIKNVIISATHTHAGPGGYWHSRSDLGLDGGFYPEHFKIIVDGITESIISAHNDLQPGSILLGKGNVTNAGANRSVLAYKQNPRIERESYSDNTPTEMSLIKFIDDSGPIGMLNWYALHPTAMNFYNRLISGDHKGYAALTMEQLQGTSYRDKNDFVAAFAQADPGDVTPNTNLNNTGPGATDVETTQIMGDRQLQVALQLFNHAEEALHGPIETRQVYVDLSDYSIEDSFTQSGPQKTCPSAYGYSFAGGSSEDGGGHFLFREGMTEQSWFLDFLIGWLTGAPKWSEAAKDCQAPKPILFETGSGMPPLQSQIRSITLARIGQLVILAMPTEVATMSGRRLRDTVINQLGDWAQHIVLAGYSNGYAGYITTPEEYLVQQYEAGHTLHGRWTLPAYQQIVSHLAEALENDRIIESAIRYDDWRGKSPESPLNSTISPPPIGSRYGDPLPQQQIQYQQGDTVIAEFWSSNPNRNYRADNNYMLVERKVAGDWQTIASDSDWNTTVRWRADKKSLVAELSWTLPEGVTAGEYRISHLGYDPAGNQFRGISDPIKIK
ncbi:MAG: neutral/alkaline non-lysosomal ceramidase N-terminal domain-containing protein [Porticoccaceae bacterium]|nr:neutral/alkaline non-lysosomal ceramidase N-terminal domain-containing protein [Porticoccaceae bacterium]